MPQISKEEWVFVVEKYFKRKSYIVVQALFRQGLNQTPTCKKIFEQNVTKYLWHGMSLNRNKENSGRRKTARSEENIGLVKKILENSPNLSRIFIGKYGRHVE